MKSLMSSRVDQLIDEIQTETRLSENLTGVAAIAPEVIAALRETPREAFVAGELAEFAYDNRPLPLSFGQTISQPFIVALMTQMIASGDTRTVLEIGCGSGYQAAVLARLVKRVVSVEIIPELAKSAAARLSELLVDNVDVHCGDGSLGWPADAPYDGILVTACARRVPPALIDQLRAGGRLLIPVGEPHGYQELRLIEKSADGTVQQRFVLPVAFVPLTGSPGA